MTDALVDANVLVALNHPGDKHHKAALKFAQEDEFTLLLPDVVLPEVAYLMRRIGGVPAVLLLLDQIVQNDLPLIPLLERDVRRARQVMAAYPRAELDLVDCCITAIAERLNITRICTFDRCDFAIIRPAHTPYFELLP